MIATSSAAWGVGRLVALSAGFFVAMLGFAATASATYPGRNGVIAYTACRGGNCEAPIEGIDAVNPDGTGNRVLVPSSETATPTAPAWSPSGRLLAYAVYAANPADAALPGIYVANAD